MTNRTGHKRDRGPTTSSAALTDQLVHQAFFALSHASPAQPALLDTRGCLSRTALAYHARRVASVLVGHGVKHDDRVGISVHDSRHYVSALLGILLCGGCCVPVSPRRKPRRQQVELARSGCRFVLTDRTWDAALSPTDPTPVDASDPYDVPTIWTVPPIQLRTAAHAPPLPAHNFAKRAGDAWIWRTTGTAEASATGHRTATRTVSALCSRLGLHEHTRTSLRQASGSELSPYAILPALSTGGTLIVPDGQAPTRPT
ncbi:AMP-binding protein [Streptomyces sp. YJ-C3]